MRPRGHSTANAETVSRRLELLSAELHGVRRGVDADEHTHLRELRPEPAGTPDAGTPDAGTPDAGTPDGRSTTVPVRPADDLAAAPESLEAAPAVPVPGRHAAVRGPGLAAVVTGWRGRVALTPAHVAVLAVLAAVGLAITAWWVIRDDPGASQIAAPVQGGPTLATPVESTGQGSASPTADVVVDVTGKVRRPGIVVLPPGSRVVDALEAAGGARPGADLSALNQARVLLDGEQIAVGVPAPPGAAASAVPAPGASSPDPSGLVSLNTATTTELEELPGVGPVTAQAIITWRDANGGFASVDQLLEVDGIGEKTLAQLAPLVTL